MNIFLLSCTDNLQVDLKNKLSYEIALRGNAVAYISSEPQDGERHYYLSTIKDFAQIGENIKVDYFDLSDNFTDQLLEKLLEYGAIYLSGGNTYIFLDSARKRNIFSILTRFLERDGLLIGASAGSIMMTPSIDIAALGDENIPDLKDTSGFGFVDFEFHPHHNEYHDSNTLSAYMGNNKSQLYVCEDGAGIFYENGKINLYGHTSKWKK